MKESESTLSIGIDVGATKIAAALVTAKGEIIALRQVDTNAAEGAQNVLNRIAHLENELAQFSTTDSKIIPNSIVGIGIGIPGQVNSKEGIVRDAVNLGWDEVYLVEEIQARSEFSYPIWIDTDANACTIGEFFFGAARDCRDFVFISIGSGLGAGVFSNGKLVVGATWKAAELGHLSLDGDGLACACGLRGCAETILSGTGLIKIVSESLEQGKFDSRLNVEKELNTEMIVAAALDQDELALSAFSKIGRHLGTIIAICASVTNPSMVVIGGGLGLAAFELITPPAWSEIKRHILPSLYSELKIVPSQLVSSAVGAASLPLYC